MTYYACGFFYSPQNKKVLLHLRDEKTSVNPNKWALFGGMAEPEDEDPIETFIREIKEELGVRLDRSQIIYLRDYLNEEKSFRRFVYWVPRYLRDDEICLNEGRGFAWLTISGALDKDLTAKARGDLEFFAREKFGLA